LMGQSDDRQAGREAVEIFDNGVDSGCGACPLSGIGRPGVSDRIHNRARSMDTSFLRTTQMGRAAERQSR
jgi:hypothetical protein